MNNEPVAWMYETELQDGTTVKRVSGAWESKYKHISDICDRGYPVPLYTHPANPKYDPETGEPLIDGYPLFSGLPPPPAKTLTDEEILLIVDEVDVPDEPDTKDLIDFARAILRKAQE